MSMVRAIGIEKVYTGEWLSMYKVTYMNQHGEAKAYEMVSKHGTTMNPGDLSLEDIGHETTAVVMAVFNHDMSKILLCKEFRMGVNQYIYNFPAGLREPGESPGDAVRRELKEETGLEVIEVLRYLKPSFTCAPVTDDVTDFIMLRAQGELRNSEDANEEIHPIWCSKQEVIELLYDNNIKFAGRTQAFCYLWANSDLCVNDL